MKKTLVFALLLIFSIGFSQPKTEMTPQGFPSVEIAKPDWTSDKLVENVRNWAAEYNQFNDFGYDVYDVSDAGMTIDSNKENAFFYTNRSGTYYHRIKYTLKVEFLPKTYRLTFVLKEVYTKQTRTELTVADFFTSTGKLKDDYLNVKPSLEKTVNNLLKSFAKYMEQTN